MSAVRIIVWCFMFLWTLGTVAYFGLFGFRISRTAQHDIAISAYIVVTLLTGFLIAFSIDKITREGK